MSDVLQEDKAERRNNLIAISITIVGFVIAFFLQPDASGSFGVYGCLLLVIPIMYTFLTERMIEAFVISGLLGAMLFTKGNFLFAYPYKLIETLTDEDTLWVILILAIMACLTQLLQISGGMTAFVDLVGKRIQSRRGVLVLSWFTSLFFFFDDYLNILLRGGTLRNLTDKHKISREMLAYVVDSTAAAVCILVPISTWAVYVAGLFEMVGYAPEGEGIAYFIKTIPFNFYAWFVLLVCLLVCLGIIPVFGPMKKAEREASLVLEMEIRKQETEEVENHKAVAQSSAKNPKIINFLIPILVLSAVTIMTEIDVLLGSFAALVFTFLFFTIQKLVNLDAFGEACIHGIKRMLQPIILLIVCFANASYFLETGFSDWLIGIVQASGIPPALIPFIVFLAVAVFEFFAGGEWITYMIMMPIFLPMAAGIGANENLVATAIIAAGILGSNICLIAEATVLSSAAVGCSVFKHMITQVPYGLIAAVFSAIGFLISGILLT